MAVTIAETGGHVTETALKSPLSPPVTMRRNDRSHSPKYAAKTKLTGQAKLRGQALLCFATCNLVRMGSIGGW
jgi:hypothetical protein